jgi:arsenate reductase
MAEELLKRIDSQNFEAQSAGASCEGLHPCAVEVMKEIGIDLGKKTPRLLQAIPEAQFDYIITLDDTTGRRFQNFQHAETIHWKIDDPLVRSKDAAEQLRRFRAVRDQLAQRLRLFVIVNVRAPVSAPTPRGLSVAR